MKITFSVILLFLFGNTLFLKAQSSNSKPFMLGITEEIQSTELSEKRILNIYLPFGYDKDSSINYPVVYLLDGSANEDFIHISGLVQFMNMYDLYPKSIVVGIANIDRKRDYTFPTEIKKDKETFPTTGSSAKFISFLEKEVQPFIEKNFKTNLSKTIIGQSLGALLATEILLKKPDLFNNYIITSPSLWWNKQSLLAQASDFLKSSSKKKINVVVSVGNEGKVMEDDAKKLAKTLQTNTNLKVSFQEFPNENHATILHQSVYKAFEILNVK